MDLSFLDEQMLEDDLFLPSAEVMDHEVTEILKKWNLSNPAPMKDFSNIFAIHQNEVFDTKTFTRPKRRTFVESEKLRSISTHETETESSSVEPGISSINMHGALSSQTMQKSWLNDVSPPNSICTSMDFRNTDNMLNSLITSSDFTNISFLLNGNETLRNSNGPSLVDSAASSNGVARNSTFKINNNVNMPKNATFTANAEIDQKDLTIVNIDFIPDEHGAKNLTFDARASGGNLTWNDIQEHQNQLNKTSIVQSTPVAEGVGRTTFNDTISPISTFCEVIPNEEGEVNIRSRKTRKLVNDITFEDYRNSMEDQCEFLLNEETIKLSSRVCGDTFETFDLKAAFIQSADANEKEFDKMLDSFDVKKSLESEKLLQSVDNIKQRHSLINFEKQREEKQKKEEECDNKSQYDTMTKSGDRLLRRSRLYDDVNLQLQKQQIETISNKTARTSEIQDPSLTAEPEDDVNIKDRDRFKTIKLNKKLQSGMVVINYNNNETEILTQTENTSTSPGTTKERRNQINLQKQDYEDVEFKRPEPAPSKISKFGFSRPTYRSRNDLNLPLKASSTDSLDNDVVLQSAAKLKSPMGFKSKSIHNLIFNGNSINQSTNRVGSYGNLRLISGAATSQSSLKSPRASSLVRTNFGDQRLKGGSSTLSAQQINQTPAIVSRKTSLVRPSSGYYGNLMPSKRLDSDESGCQSLSSSSASSRNSVHVAIDNNHFHQPNAISDNEEPLKALKNPSRTGAIPKPPSGLRPPSNLRMPMAKSGLPRPSSVVRR